MILSSEFFSDLPQEIFIHITSFTGACKIFLRQVCNYWNVTLSTRIMTGHNKISGNNNISSTHHWLDIILNENRVNLLEEAVNQGFHIYAGFFKKALKIGNIELLNYLHNLEISHHYFTDEIDDIDSVKWLKENGYDVKIEWDLYMPIFPLDIAEYLFSTGDCDIDVLDCAILTTDNIMNVK